MTISNNIITMIAKKDYKEFEKELNKELEVKMKHHLSGFSNYIEKTAFKKED